MDLIARATVLPGDGVAYEEPGYQVARSALQLNGARIVPTPVDIDGMQVEHLQRLSDPPALAFVSPSHQYPTGARMSVAVGVAWPLLLGTLALVRAKRRLDTSDLVG